MLINDNWQFKRGALDTIPRPFKNTDWESITLPHDWAIDGPMSGWNSPAVTPDGLVPDGNTAGLPYQGAGCYRRELFIPENQEGRVFRLEFDGVMSHATIYVNGKLAGKHAYGYTSFALDITPYLHFGRVPNELLVEADNPNYLCRWYPGAGIYRDVRLLSLDPRGHFPYNGVQLLTDDLDVAARTATLRAHADGIDDARLTLTVKRNDTIIAKGGNSLELKDIDLWSTDSPNLYHVTVSMDTDEVTIPYGFRKLHVTKDGMTLNDQPFRFKGLCMHHDLGIFGAAFHKPVMQWRLRKIKALGCNALRMAHNPPDPKLLDICDELGFLVMDEAFDVWKAAKTAGDYHNDFEQCHATDLRSLIRRDRNHPSVALWSIGNEIREEATPTSGPIARELRDICHQEDPTRPVTAACSHQLAEDNTDLHDFLDALDVLGFNYKPNLYKLLRERFPEKPVLASETSATLSTRGEYIPNIPVQCGDVVHDSGYPSAYATEYSRWSNDNEAMFQAMEDHPWFLGEFAWCTYEYLGEPHPHNWPARSSCFALFDFAGIQKDRAWLYAAQWRSNDMPHVLHILAHWEWPQNTRVPIQLFTSCAEVELLLNGKSLGRRKRGPFPRMDWGMVDFTPGQLTAIGYDNNGNELARDSRTTPGAPAHIVIDAQTEPAANGTFIFAQLSLADSRGYTIETASETLHIAVTGNARLCGVDNGDAHCHLPFKRNSIALFHGRAMVTLFAKGAAMLTVKGAHCQAQFQFP